MPTPAGGAALAAVALAGQILGGLACSTQEAAAPEDTLPAAARVRVTEVALGRSVGLDKKVRQPSEVFDPADTVYVSVVTEGTSPDTLLGARWRRGERVLEETTQAIAPEGTATSEFHVARPGGFESGEYAVEILLEGRAVLSRRFTVR